MFLDKHFMLSILISVFMGLIVPKVSAQTKSILVFDPLSISQSFQNSFHQLSPDSIYVADTLDENINNFDALFLFTGYPYVLSEEEGNRLTAYLNLNKPVYLYTDLGTQHIDSVGFWNYIGFTNFGWLPTSTTVDRIIGVDTTFTGGIVIDTSFISGDLPGVDGNISPVLTGVSDSSISITTAFIPADESKQVIVDLYNIIYHSEFLERVIVYFGLDKVSIVLDDNDSSPNLFSLSQNYPNPFNPSTKIRYEIPGQARNDNVVVILKVYNVLGDEVATLVNGKKPAGSYEVEFDGNRLPSGIYFYQLQAGNFIQTKKMVLLR